jgi:uncharacterized DUF497 family protein
MIDFSRVVGFDWEQGNAYKNEKHGVSQGEAEKVFFDRRLLVVEDGKRSSTEPRYHALGQTLEGHRLHITFTLRHEGTRIRVISARDMHRKARELYEKET